MEIILFDAYNLVHRCHYASQPDYDPNVDGEPVGFLHGVFSAVSRIRQKYWDAALVFCWDGTGEIWRKKIYPEYKANRKETPGKKELYAMIPTLKRALHALLGYKGIAIPELEGDDVIGILAEHFSRNQHSTVRIYSTDEDLYQLLKWNVYVIRPNKKHEHELFGQRAFFQEYGLKPDKWIHIISLAGGHDNIPGIRGVGPQTAKMYAKYGAASHLDWELQPDSLKEAFPALAGHWDTPERRVSSLASRIPRSLSELTPYVDSAKLRGYQADIDILCQNPYRLAVSKHRYDLWKAFLERYPFDGAFYSRNVLLRGK
jgi:5'-3' exonuclease